MVYEWHTYVRYCQMSIQPESVHNVQPLEQTLVSLTLQCNLLKNELLRLL